MDEGKVIGFSVPSGSRGGGGVGWGVVEQDALCKRMTNSQTAEGRA